MTARTLVFLSLAIGLVAPVSLAAADAPERFSRDVAPIFVKRCLECHNERDAAGKLVLIDRSSLTAGGESGPAVIARNPDQSNLLTRVLAGEMPPPKRGHSQKLADAEIAVLRDWIATGANWPDGRKLDLYEATSEVRGGRDWWSLQPVTRPGIPSLNVPKRDSIDSPVDAFIQAKLSAARMQPAPVADRATLIKRVSFDLLGLPPTYEDVQEFVADTAPDAFERLVDRLLASPQFGERWGRYWLDIVRYADTCGYERDQEKPFAWKYRDWVVSAINADIPYDQFILEQLAGDELPDRSENSVIATGFLRLGTWNDEPNDPDEYKYERLEDMVHTTSTAFLGLTVKCARCHDHKFDPIPQTDYYRMAAAFWPGAIDPRGRELLGGPTKDELGYDVMGWTDIRQPPPLHLLRKGEPKHPLGVVDPGHLSLVPAMNRPLEPAPLGAKTTHRRRQLAEWIASPHNPLTPRVLANRYWMNHFGAGLVRSVDNFGYTGDNPTHPELLDWLASEITSHDRTSGWTSLKRFHRLLVTSATFRQSSLHPQQDQYVAHDAGNHLWWHAERRRLDSEPLRDRLLFVGGDLDTRMTGPGFKPTIQAEALEGLSRKEGAWKPSPAHEQRRRAVYMFSQRSLLPPLMTTFDFVDTTLPCVQRPVSTVAPQALALLNNGFAHERSTALALRIRREIPAANTGDNKLRERHIQRAWQVALSRNPTVSEIAAAKAHLETQAARFATPKSSHAVPEASLPTAGLTLHLSASTAVRVDREGRVEEWLDQSGQNHHATQPVADQRPLLVKNAINSQPILRLDGQRRFMHLAGQVVTSQSFAIFAVVTDQSTTNSHREIFSNWNGSAGNSGTSLFLGMTGVDTTRLCDDFSGVGHVTDRQKPFVLSGVNAANGVAIHQTGNELSARPQPIGPRNLKTNYVIGQQGNIDGEYWHGDIAELLVYDRELKDAERQAITRYLAKKYKLSQVREATPDRSPDFLALASLCHVLLNTNEFVYVD
ncbi:MAG: PSD1 domain-containing protein [Planctomycetes bacterium]|nr:PSD1 domain-containing protein [Planctomycetota bacterium]